MSPLSIELLRNPGESLQEKIHDINYDVILRMLFIPIIPVTVYSMALSNITFREKHLTLYQILFYIIISISSTLYFCFSIYKLLLKKNWLRLGVECEIAVGQDLQNLLIHKFKIFHDFPAKKFNIDHIAIGPTGIFAIETKGRSKFVKKENENWKVEFDGQKLIFPGWNETKALEQSKRQASWLKDWIKQATDENVHVTPVLALPGWYIDRKELSDIKVYNGKNSTFLAKGNEILTNKQIQIIADKIEKECRNITIKSYKQLA